MVISPMKLNSSQLAGFWPIYDSTTNNLLNRNLSQDHLGRRINPEIQRIADEPGISVRKVHEMNLRIPAAAARRLPLDTQRVRRRAENLRLHRQAMAFGFELTLSRMRRGGLEIHVGLLAVVEDHVAVVIVLRSGGAIDAQRSEQNAKGRGSNRLAQWTIPPVQGAAPLDSSAGDVDFLSEGQNS